MSAKDQTEACECYPPCFPCIKCTTRAPHCIHEMHHPGPSCTPACCPTEHANASTADGPWDALGPFTQYEQYENE